MTSPLSTSALLLTTMPASEHGAVKPGAQPEANTRGMPNRAQAMMRPTAPSLRASGGDGIA